MKKTVFVLLTLILIVGGCGLATISQLVTPAEKDEASVEYVTEAKVAEPNEYNGYFNIYKANKLVGDVDEAHEVIQFDLNHLIERDNLDYSNHKDAVIFNHTVASQREEMLFGETGLLSMGLSMLGVGGLSGFVGLMRKRPGDITSADAEKAIADATGKSSADLSDKQKQFAQLVGGITKIMKTYEGQKTVIDDMKHIFNETQDTETQVAVASVKKSA